LTDVARASKLRNVDSQIQESLTLRTLTDAENKFSCLYRQRLASVAFPLKMVNCVWVASPLRQETDAWKN